MRRSFAYIMIAAVWSAISCTGTHEPVQEEHCAIMTATKAAEGEPLADMPCQVFFRTGSQMYFTLDLDGLENTDYNTGRVYPSSYQTVSACAVAPCSSDGSQILSASGDFSTVNVNYGSKGYDNSLWSVIAGTQAVSASSSRPFTAQRPLEFTYSAFRVRFQAIRSHNMNHMGVLDTKVVISPEYVPFSLDWDSRSGAYVAKGKSYAMAGGLDVPLRSGLANDVILQSSYATSDGYVYLCKDDYSVAMPKLHINMDVNYSTDTDTYAESARFNRKYGSLYGSQDLTVDLVDKNGNPVTDIRGGQSYVVTIVFDQDSFTLSAELEDWEDGGNIVVPLPNPVPDFGGGAKVLAGGFVGSVRQGFDTKASVVDNLPSVPETPVAMPEGSTMYLMVEELDGFRDPVTRKDTLWRLSQTYPMKPYVVGGGSSLYPCRVDDDGNCLEIVGSPLMLQNGTYRFHAVHPARKLVQKDADDFVMLIRNGEYVIGSDVRWKETYPTGVTVEIGTDSHTQEVYLHPLIHQTSLFKINIRMGENVSKLELLPDGVEISGIQSDEGSGIDYHWSINGAQLPMRVGDKYKGIRIMDWYEWTDAEGNEYLTGSVPILPTDASTNSIYVMLNLEVNDTPTQYMTTLRQQYYESAYCYEYWFRVDVRDGITVATWDNISIVRDGDDGDFTTPGTIDYAK